MKKKGENRLPHVRHEVRGGTVMGRLPHEEHWSREERHKAFESLRPAFFRAMTMRMLLKRTRPAA